MPFDNVLRQIKVIVYRLKRNYGLNVTFVKHGSTTHNITTGKITRNLSAFKVRRVPVLAAKSLRDFVYDIAYLAANKNFTYGAYFDDATRILIVDVKDIPSDWEFTPDQYCNFNHQRWNIKEVFDAEHRKSVLLVVKRVSNEPANEVFLPKANQYITFTQTVTGTIT